MENSILIFKSAQFGEIRTAGTADEPLFCAVDVARALGYSRPADAITTHCKGVVILPTPTAGGVQDVKFIKEPEVYRLVFKSKAPDAEKFNTWLAEEVLPSIRKTGGYIAGSEQMSEEEIMAKALLIGQKTIERQRERINTLEAENMTQQAVIEQKDEMIGLQDAELKKQAPKVNYYDHTMQSVTTMTTTQVAKAMGMETHVLTKNLKDAEVIYRQSGMWMLRAPYSGMGLHSVRVHTHTKDDGSVATNQYTVWTEKGKRFIVAMKENGWSPRKAAKVAMLDMQEES